MDIDKKQLSEFEAGLNPLDINASTVPGKIIGYGEISAIFQIKDDTSLVYKRMPIFDSVDQAEDYDSKHGEYCKLLSQAGLTIPEHESLVVDTKGRPVSLYIVQKQLKGEQFCHKLIHTLEKDASLALIEQIIEEMQKVWKYNNAAGPAMELALDGQLSNWVRLEDNTLNYIDTSTPLFKIDGIEQQNPELMLKSCPSFLVWIIRAFFLSDVMERYYDFRLVCIDLAANLFKEQKQDLIAETISIINRYLPENQPELTIKEVESYYKEDKLIWSLFLAFRKLDRWIKTKLLGKRYEYLLPGNIKR